ncbi:hypothetical protein [Stenotrophomonas sp. SAU14A_NAIMI4_5]|uniref:hypothetical protein n=1 Tax=Stenotrophomonas sp. SAU14A_NAIMI4_5 TaxID=2072413 RepID=UPI00131F088D|nr:hypothetical protein [Stenotrophomonas sp. SAU14A_NAIMI4_5]
MFLDAYEVILPAAVLEQNDANPFDAITREASLANALVMVGKRELIGQAKIDFITTHGHLVIGTIDRLYLGIKAKWVDVALSRDEPSSPPAHIRLHDLSTPTFLLESADVNAIFVLHFTGEVSFTSAYRARSQDAVDAASIFKGIEGSIASAARSLWVDVLGLREEDVYVGGQPSANTQSPVLLDEQEDF